MADDTGFLKSQIAIPLDFPYNEGAMPILTPANRQGERTVIMQPYQNLNSAGLAQELRQVRQGVFLRIFATKYIETKKSTRYED